MEKRKGEEDLNGNVTQKNVQGNNREVGKGISDRCSHACTSTPHALLLTASLVFTFLLLNQSHFDNLINFAFFYLFIKLQTHKYCHFLQTPLVHKLIFLPPFTIFSLSPSEKIFVLNSHYFLFFFFFLQYVLFLVYCSVYYKFFYVIFKPLKFI